MGMYNELHLTCKCGIDFTLQTKAGDCTLTNLTMRNISQEEAEDLDGEEHWCECGRQLTVRIEQVIQPKYHIHLIEDD